MKTTKKYIPKDVWVEILKYCSIGVLYNISKLKSSNVKKALEHISKNRIKYVSSFEIYLCLTKSTFCNACETNAVDGFCYTCEAALCNNCSYYECSICCRQICSLCCGLGNVIAGLCTDCTHT